MNQNKENVIKYIDDNASLFTDVADKIWENPELSLQEYYASDLYTQVLKTNGFEVTTNLCGIPTAFCAKYGSGKPTIGILGEYDALSGLSQQAHSLVQEPVTPGAPGHGCGHNLLGAGSLAASMAIKNYLETTGHSGTVIFFGCPGEEGVASKAFMAIEGIWKELDCALSWHPTDVNQVVTGTNISSLQVLYHFHGIPAHASASPENGRSALDAVEIMNIGVQFLREHMASDCKVHYAIIDAGGTSPNVVQPEASVLYMVRANKVKDALELLKRVDKIAEGASLMSETTYERTFIDGTSEVIPNFALEDVLQQNLSDIGVPSYTNDELAFAQGLRESYQVNKVLGYGPTHDKELEQFFLQQSDNLKKGLCDFVLPSFHGEDMQPSSTDVGDVSYLTATAQVNTACFPLGAPNHSWQNVSCGKTTIAHKGMLYAGKVLATTFIDLVENPELILKAQEEFKERTKDGYICPIEDGTVAKALSV